MTDLPIQPPARYLPLVAIAFADDGGNGTTIDAAHPLPVSTLIAEAASDPPAGAAVASGSFGPFTPELGRPIWLTLSGSWSGSVAVKRSVDGGVTKLPLTVGGAAWGGFTGNACEPVAEESEAAAEYYLDVALVSGTLAYRVAQ